MSKQATLLPPRQVRFNGDLLRRTFTARVGELRAALLFASNDETRHVLNSVLVEVKPGKPPLMISTDGRRLSVIESVADQGESPTQEEFTLILSAEFLKPLVAFAKGQSSEMHFDYHPSERIIANFVGQKCFVDCEQGALIQGDYPNWRAVLPPKTVKKQFVPHIGVNAEFVADYAKAAKFLDAPAVIAVNLIDKDGAMEVRIESRPQFYGVLMPSKVDEDKEWQPEFLDLIGYQPTPDPDENTLSDDAAEKEVAA